MALATVATYCFARARHLCSTARVVEEQCQQPQDGATTAPPRRRPAAGGGDADISASIQRASSNVSSTTGVRGDNNAASG